MKRGIGLKISASAIGILLSGSIFYVVRDKKRGELAKELFSELEKRFNPSATGLMQEKAFDINYMQRVLDSVKGQVIVIKESTALGFANQLHSAWQPWYKGGDKEDLVYGVFRQLTDKVQVSQIAKAYQSAYGINLIDVLVERFDTTELQTLLTIVRTLPDYRAV